jgi:uncharacterized protein (UPF0303 family)
LAQEPRLTLLSFDADTAWDLGCTIRALAVEKHPGRAICISIIHASTDKPMFFARTPGVTPSQISRLEGIRNAVKCLEMSTWRAWHRFGGNKEPVGGDCDLSPGGWPIRVRGVEGIVAVLIVQGLGFQLTKDGSIETIQFTYSSGCFGSVEAASLDHELILSALNMIHKQ